MREPRRCDKPPPPKSTIWVTRIRGNATMRVIACGKIWGFYTHWDGRKSIPCTGEDKDCHGHCTGMPLRWKGYIYAYQLEKQQYCFIELTPLMAEQINFQLDPDMPSPRGYWIEFRRGGGDKARCKVTVQSLFHSVEQLLPDKDPICTLRDLMGIPAKNAKKLDHPPVA